jgi:hypothetical protein
MLRSLAAIGLLLVLGLSLLAAEYKGKLKSVDRDKNTITVTVGDEDKTFTVGDDVKFTRGKTELKNKLKSKAFDKNANTTVTLITEGEGDNEVLKEVKIAPKKKDKPNKPDKP